MSYPRPTVAAVMAPNERSSLEAASSGWFSVLHHGSLPEAIRAVRERSVDAVLVSAEQCRPDQVAAVDRLIRGFPDIPTVVVVSRHDPTITEMILRLGATGIRQIVDVTGPSGWNSIRHLLAEPVSRPAARILARVFEALPPVPPQSRTFLEVMVRLAPSTPIVRDLAAHFRARPSTLMSRFARAGLPTPKTYLAAVRLLYAAQYFEWEGMGIADVAYRLEYSSPQSFGRHLKAVLGATPTEFRRRFPFVVALNRFLDVLVVPYGRIWEQFRPLGGD